MIAQLKRRLNSLNLYSQSSTAMRLSKKKRRPAVYYRQLLTDDVIETHPLNYAGAVNVELEGGLRTLHVYIFHSAEQFDYAVNANDFRRIKLRGLSGADNGKIKIH